jgi:hypothetical protein
MVRRKWFLLLSWNSVDQKYVVSTTEMLNVSLSSASGNWTCFDVFIWTETAKATTRNNLFHVSFPMPTFLMKGSDTDGVPLTRMVEETMVKGHV